MGRVISLINTTPDGFVDAPHAVIDPEYFEFTHSMLNNIQTVAFGRKTFEQFQNTWPQRLEQESTPDWQRKMAVALTAIPKIVYSSNLKTTSWNNATIVSKPNAEHFQSYKEEGKGGLLTIGSLSLVESLTQMNVIDDYYFCMQPMLAGHGNVRLFDKVKLDTVRSLRYLDSKTLKSGVHIVHYQHA